MIVALSGRNGNKDSGDSQTWGQNFLLIPSVSPWNLGLLIHKVRLRIFPRSWVVWKIPSDDAPSLPGRIPGLWCSLNVSSHYCCCCVVAVVVLINSSILIL